MSQILAIVGMHRSGTSALAEAMVAAGAWFGEPAMAAAATPQRPLGLVERKDFLRLTNAALAEQSCSWDDILGFRQDWDTTAQERLRTEFSTTVLADFAAHELAVLKDPRLCLLLPLFRPLMPELFGLMVVRHPLEVAASLHARNAVPFPLGVALWEAYNRYAVRVLREVPSIIIQHRHLVQKPPSCIRESCERLSELGIVGLRRKAAIQARTINRNAYHQRAPSLTYRKLSDAQREFWMGLREAASPADVPIGELSEESQNALAAHHARPSVPQTTRKPATT